MKKKISILLFLFTSLSVLLISPYDVEAADENITEINYSKSDDITNNTDDSRPVIIGSYDGLLIDALDTESLESNEMTISSVAQVRINSYATYDSNKGIQVYVRLYVPLTSFPKPQFTSMIGTVTVNINGRLTTKTLAEYANGSSSIDGTVDTGVKGSKGTNGIISISGIATANNALSGGGGFGISYDFTIP